MILRRNVEPEDVMRGMLAIAALAAAAAPLAAQQHDHARMHPMSADSDSAFAAMQARGRTVMGVDQATSRHAFEPLADGGRIELQRMVDDTAGVTEIRRHLSDIAEAFARGDFSAAAAVHAEEVPGTRVMAAKRRAIRYRMSPLPRGGEVRITTRDPEAVAAVHEFLTYQRREHRAAEH
jgi:hypothetical protein